MKKRIVIGSVLTILTIAIISTVFILQENKRIKQLEEEQLVEVIKNSYSKYVVVNAPSTLFIKDENDLYHSKGTAYEGYEFELAEFTVNNSTDRYFPIANSDYYIDYKYLTSIEKLSTYDQDYKRYIPFNENITGISFGFYVDNNLVLEIQENLNLPIIIKEDTQYGVEYDGRLMYVKKSESIAMTAANNSDEPIAKDITVLLYHFFHNHDRYEELRTCIYMRIDKFESQMKYLTDNNWTTLSMQDLDLYIDGKINLPKKSVVLTIDDGHDTIYTYASPIMEKYNIKATIFNIESAHPGAISKATKNVEIHSHTYNMHEYSCGGKGAITCISQVDGVADLQKASQALNNSLYLAYPFGHYNDHAINILKDAGYKLAFTTDGGTVKVGTNKYKIPRYYIYNEWTLDNFINRITN